MLGWFYQSPVQEVDANKLSVIRFVGLAVFLLLQACSTPQIYSNAKYQTLEMGATDLEKYGMAFLTPTTVTGKEEDKQVLALIFAEAISELRPDIHTVTLPQVLSKLNNAGLAKKYKAMVIDYQDTGIFDREVLADIGDVVGVRYIAQLKLSEFFQYSQGRFSALGVRLLQTKQAHIRVFFQIWDSHTGSIAWEAVEELNYAYDTSAEEPVSFNQVVRQAAENLISNLP